MSDAPGGAASMRQTAAFGYRYQYLAGGVNTGGGWATWNPNGNFVTYYIQDSVANQMTPVFTYYQIRQSSPGNNMGESDGVGANLQNTATMTAFYSDLKLFFQRASGSATVVLHVEPDMWGYIQQRAAGDNAATVPARVAATGLSELNGLPDNASGMARAIVRLRDQYAPNVVLGYHISTWGTGEDIVYTNPSDSRVTELGTRAGNFFMSLQANFDLAFAEFSDRDAAFKQYVYGDGGASWWDAGDFSRHARFLTTFVGTAQKRIMMWQIPLGNTKMRAMNNTNNHYQDNRVEWLLANASRNNLRTYIDAGVIAFLFGRGADGATCACDANNDGVTNPTAINGNNITSLNADDDGGFFRQQAANYYSVGVMPLSGGSLPPTSTATAPPRTPTPTRTQTPNSTATKTPTGTSSQTLGMTTVGSSFDIKNSNYMTGSRFTTSSNGGATSTMSVYVGGIDSAPNNRFQLAIYSDLNGRPGTLLAKSATGTLKANGWNTLPISANLSPNTSYWLMYNTNGRNQNLNNMPFSTPSGARAAYKARKYGAWPQSFSGTNGGWTNSTSAYSIYVLYGTASSGTAATPTRTPTSGVPANTTSAVRTSTATRTVTPTRTATPVRTATPWWWWLRP